MSTLEAELRPRLQLISIVAPMFNEEESVERFVGELSQHLIALTDFNFEILLVDDGSKDLTATLVREVQKHQPSLRLIQLSRNFGHQAAITAGVFEARGDAVIVMDSDLQDPPHVIEQMLDEWSRGADVVYAVRRQREGETRFKKLSAKLFYRLLQTLSDTEIPADTGDFRLMSRQVVEVLRSMPERDRYMRGMVAWVGFNQVPVYFDRDARHAGESKYPLKKMIRLGLSGVVGFSDKPLYLAVVTGFVVMGLAIAGLLYVLLSIAFGWGSLVQGWASVVVSVMFFSATQLIFLGVIGIYISRIFQEVKQRPLYVISRDSLKEQGSE